MPPSRQQKCGVSGVQRQAYVRDQGQGIQHLLADAEAVALLKLLRGRLPYQLRVQLGAANVNVLAVQSGVLKAGRVRE